MRIAEKVRETLGGDEPLEAFMGPVERGLSIVRQWRRERHDVTETMTTSLLLLWSVLGATVGVLAILVAVRERRRSSGWWMLPGIFGMLLLANSFFGWCRQYDDRTLWIGGKLKKLARWRTK